MDSNKIRGDEIPKKRGRKPKPKNIEETKIPKKRGRKPKEKLEEDINVRPQRKRGRKPKEKVYSVMKPIVAQSNNDDENVILHLPINPDDIDEENEINTVLEHNVSLDEPMPYEPISNYGIVDKDICHHQTLYERIDEENIESQTNLPKIEKNEEVEEEISDFKGEEQVLVRRNVTNIMFEFIDSNNRHTWPRSTNICCMWCCHSFDSLPCAIPDKYISGKFYLFGCFCSFNCAAAYNFSQKSYSIWERYSLMNLLYRNIYQKTLSRIKPAPPKQTLKMFGGFLSIEQFRKNFTTNRVYNIIEPPMIAIIPKVEENIYENVKKNSKFIPVDDVLVQNAALKLKREKPLTQSGTTLVSFMGLKIV